jgi:hypothetical protein
MTLMRQAATPSIQMATPATPPHPKRKRTEGLENDPVTIQRGDPWFEDGNIVLQAELTQFKVYGGILSGKSDIFKDMFAMPKPQAGEELLGCPVVHMMCDTAQDWHHVLKALCDRWYVRSPLMYLGFASFSVAVNLQLYLCPDYTFATCRGSCFFTTGDEI